MNGIPNLMLYVVKEDGPSLMGRDWMGHLRLDWKAMFSGMKAYATTCEHDVDSMFSMKQTTEVDDLIAEYKDLFKFGNSKAMKLKLYSTKRHPHNLRKPNLCLLHSMTRLTRYLPEWKKMKSFPRSSSLIWLVL